MDNQNFRGLGEDFQRGFVLEDATSFTRLMLELYQHRCCISKRQFEPVATLPHPDLDIYLLQPLNEGGELSFGNALVVERAVARLLGLGEILIVDDYRMVRGNGVGCREPLLLHHDRAFWPSRAALDYHLRRFLH